MTGANRSEQTDLDALETPALLLDETRMLRNVARLRAHLRSLGVPLRPHLKTSKCFEVIRAMCDEWPAPITVSTLREAEIAADWGARNILYAVGMTPGKLDRVLALRQRGVDLSIVVDNVATADGIGARASAAGAALPILIEIDSDDHRSGVKPAAQETLTAIASRIAAHGSEVRGVLAHAGDSYNDRSVAALETSAERERAAVCTAADVLRANGWNCPTVSVGSTPTAHFARNLKGVTEVRAGVYAFFDLVMNGIGVCALDDIALSVMASVIGHQEDKGWIIIDAGWMALSRDRGTAGQSIDQGYGIVCNRKGVPFDDLVVTQANQEHGIVALRDSSKQKLPDFPVGTRLRILPNHACATAAQHSHYHVMRADGIAVWRRFNGW